MKEKRLLLKEPFQYFINPHKVDFRIFLERYIQVLIPAMMELPVTLRAQKHRPLNFSHKSVPHQKDMVQLQLFVASANIAMRVSFHQDPLYFFASAAKMTITSLNRNLTSLLFHTTTS
jgi:hypothetical protein